MKTTSEPIARRLRIHGLVQGVGYRNALQAQAARLGLAGWVRNRLDGTVEALVAGPPQAVDALVAWSRRGPSAARVERVDTEAADPPTHATFVRETTC
jgi:acylphosphatase